MRNCHEDESAWAKEAADDDQAEAKQFEAEVLGGDPNWKRKMLDFKARCAGDVRWRSLGVAHVDPYIENYMSSMLGMLGPTEQTLGDFIWQGYNREQNIDTDAQTLPTSLSGRCKQFLEDARKRSLQIREWKGNPDLLAGKDFFPSVALHSHGKVQCFSTWRHSS